MTLKFPSLIPLAGTWCDLEPINTSHLEELWDVCENETASFSHTRYGPYPDRAALQTQLEDFATRTHQPFWVVRPKTTGRAAGWLSICDVDETVGALEIGAIWFAPELQRTTAATETIYLLMHHGFETCGYGRVVWRCFNDNAASLRAAKRFGFKPEGLWRNGGALDGTPKDVAWHSMLKQEWPPRREAIEAWLKPSNFTAEGIAKASLRPSAMLT